MHGKAGKDYKEEKKNTYAARRTEGRARKKKKKVKTEKGERERERERERDCEKEKEEDEAKPFGISRPRSMGCGSLLCCVAS
jgi:hypothetical protein